jgi:hypothetical protein
MDQVSDKYQVIRNGLSPALLCEAVAGAKRAGEPRANLATGVGGSGAEFVEKARPVRDETIGPFRWAVPSSGAAPAELRPLPKAQQSHATSA